MHMVYKGTSKYAEAALHLAADAFWYKQVAQDNEGILWALLDADVQL